MKKIVVTFLLLLPIMAMAQKMKVVESSERKAPSWVGASAPDVFIVTASAHTLDQAKKLALQDVKKQIIEAVALHVTSETNITLSQTTTQGDNISEMNQQMDSKFQTHAAKLPFVKGISLNKVNRYYWEKVRNKETKVETYGYTIEYPFSQTDLRKLTVEFDKIDNEMVRKLAVLENIALTFKSTEELDGAVSVVPVLENYFFDDVRIERTKAASTLARKQYNYITPVIAFNSTSQAVILLAVGERIITSTQRPNVKSNCATEVNVIHNDGKVLVNFDNSGCVDSEENYVEISYRFGGRIAKDKAYFNINANQLDVKIKGQLDVVFKDSTTATIKLQLLSNNVPFEITSCYVKLPELLDPLTSNTLVEMTQGTIHNVEMTLVCSDEMQQKPSDAINLASGYVIVRNKINGDMLVVDVNHPYSVKMIKPVQ